MLPKETIEVEKLIKLFCEVLDKSQKEKLRNKLFLLLNDQIIKWMMSIMKNKMYFTAAEMKSNCWECFLFCLSYYKPEKKIPTLNHFYAYTKFYLLSKTVKRESDYNYDDNGVRISYENTQSYDLSLYEALDDLKTFKNCLPIEYQSVFDDALMSMSKGKQDRVRRLNETSVKYYQYCESKKIFKVVIDFLLRR